MKTKIIVLILLNTISLLTVLLGCLSKSFFSVFDIIILLILTITLLVQLFVFLTECRKTTIDNIVMTNDFAELSANELEVIEGGWNWGTVLGGAALVVGCVGVAASGPVGWVAGAALCGASALGGSAIGWGMTQKAVCCF